MQAGGPGPRHPLPKPILGVTVVTLVILAASLASYQQGTRSVLTVDVRQVIRTGGNVTLDLGLTAGEVSVGVHTALIAGALRGPLPIYVFYDPQYPVLFASLDYIYGLEGQLQAMSSLSANPSPVSLASAAEVTSLIQSHVPAVLVVLGGVLPDTVMNNRSAALLDSWIQDGGELVWAGGPLGWATGHPSGGGTFYWSPPFWGGQKEILGFPLTDPFTQGPLTGQQGSPWTQSLGLGYDGTVFGANISEVVQHGGTAMGFVAPGNVTNGPRTSLAFVPMGSGSLLYFGGSFLGNRTFVPEANHELANDLFLLSSLGYIPRPGGADSVDTSLTAGASTTVQLTVSDAVQGVAALVDAPSVAGYVYLWGSSFPAQAAPSPAGPDMGPGSLSISDFAAWVERALRSNPP